MALPVDKTTTPGKKKNSKKFAFSIDKWQEAGKGEGTEGWALFFHPSLVEK